MMNERKPKLPDRSVITPETLAELLPEISGQIDLPVVSADDAEEVDMVVCNRVGMPTRFRDNEYGTCSICGFAIYFRPHIPRRPRRVCVTCALQTSH